MYVFGWHSILVNIVSVWLKRTVSVLLKHIVSSFACEKTPYNYTQIILVAFIYCYSVAFHIFFILVRCCSVCMSVSANCVMHAVRSDKSTYGLRCTINCTSLPFGMWQFCTIKK